MKKELRYTILVISIIALNFASCKNTTFDNASDETPLSQNTDTSSSNLRKVTFLPYWVINAQFAGFYAGKELGIFKKYGIDLEIIDFQPFYTSNELLRTGEADFAAIWLVNAIGVKASGVDIVNIAQFSSRSSLMLVTKKSSGINEIEDMNNKRLGVWQGFELQPVTLFKKFHLNVELISIGSTNNLFLHDGVDITAANWFDEYHSIINSGYNPDELNTFFFADYGLNFLEDGIYCLSTTLSKDPKLCADFVKATAESWTFAFNNPEKAIDIVIACAQKANIPVNKVHQRWMLDRYRDLYFSTGKTTTELSVKDYMFAAKVMKESNMIQEIVPYEDFFKHYTNFSR
jgi:NitT/TauT family transport system substrate-binding protein